MGQDDPNFGKEWLDCKKVMPLAVRMYWVTDGNSTALAQWDVANMQWHFRYMYSVFKPIAMLPVKLPPIPEKFKIREAT